MRGYLAALALGLPNMLGAAPLAAQSQQGDEQAAEPLTAERIMEVGRERLRPPGVWRPCPLPQTPTEIVVCAEDPGAQRVESPTDDAIRRGEAVDDGLPRAPNVFGIPPCKSYLFCAKVGRAPEAPLIVDLTQMPEPVSEEEARLIYKVEDGPPREAPLVPGEEPAP